MGEMRDDDSDSDTDDVPSTGSAPEPNRVLLAKIFMSTPNPANSQCPLIAEWDGTDPGHTKRLFVYAHIDNSTYESYVTLSDSSRKRFKYVNTLGDGRSFHRGYDKLMQTGPFSNYLQSCVHNPRAYDSYRWPHSPELETALSNFMNGTLSFVNRRDVRDKHRVYMFDLDRTIGIPSSRSFDVTPPEFTYWYKLNNSSGQDRPTQGPPETIRNIPEEEFTSNYKIFQNFNPANPHTFVESRERGKLLKGRRQLTTPRSGGKKRNKSRRKYRKIKSRRRVGW